MKEVCVVVRRCGKPGRRGVLRARAGNRLRPIGCSPRARLEVRHARRRGTGRDEPVERAIALVGRNADRGAGLPVGRVCRAGQRRRDIIDIRHGQAEHRIVRTVRAIGQRLAKGEAVRCGALVIQRRRTANDVRAGDSHTSASVVYQGKGGATRFARDRTGNGIGGSVFSQRERTSQSRERSRLEHVSDGNSNRISEHTISKSHCRGGISLVVRRRSGYFDDTRDYFEPVGVALGDKSNRACCRTKDNRGRAHNRIGRRIFSYVCRG